MKNVGKCQQNLPSKSRNAFIFPPPPPREQTSSVDRFFRGGNSCKLGSFCYLTVSGVCISSLCFINADGHRAVINSKEEEKFILEQIDDIFVEIGLTVSDSLENDDLVWDYNANGIQADQLQWYKDEQPRFKEPNCLATDCRKKLSQAQMPD